MFRPLVSSVVPILLVATAFVAPAALADDDMTCVDCHDLDAPAFENSVHGFMDCVDCHMDADPLPHEDVLTEVDCAMCHDDVVEQTAASVHGQDCSIHGWETPGCQTCHGDTHTIVSSTDESSPMYEKNQAETCGECHGNPDYLDAKGVRTVRPVAAYESSVHSRAVQGGVHAATCSSCHTPHSTTSPRRSRGSTSTRPAAPATRRSPSSTSPASTARRSSQEYGNHRPASTATASTRSCPRPRPDRRPRPRTSRW